MQEGRLVVCATPIGNLGDVTLRVLDALREADTVLAEDTRVTCKLFGRYDIHTPLERFDENTAERKTPEVTLRISNGETIAIVSDAGTPGISDPGTILVDAALEMGLKLDVLPGPSAIVTALVASGLPAHAFYFGGFLPRKDGEARRFLQGLAGLDATLVFYESPHRVARSMQRIAEELPGRQAAMARELTKLHEEVVRRDVAELAEELNGRELKGEVVLLVGPGSGESRVIDEEEVREAVLSRVAMGETKKDAIRGVAEETGVPRNLVYRIAHEESPPA